MDCKTNKVNLLNEFVLNIEDNFFENECTSVN